MIRKEIRSRRHLLQLPFELLNDYDEEKESNGEDDSGGTIEIIEESDAKPSTNEPSELDLTGTFTLLPTDEENDVSLVMDEIAEDLVNKVSTSEPSELDLTSTFTLLPNDEDTDEIELESLIETLMESDQEESSSSGTSTSTPTVNEDQIVSKETHSTRTSTPEEESLIETLSDSASSSLYPTADEGQVVSSAMNHNITDATHSINASISTSLTQNPSEANLITSSSSTLMPTTTSSMYATSTSSYEFFNSTFMYVGKSTTTNLSQVSYQTDTLMLVSLSIFFISVVAIFVKSRHKYSRIRK